MIKGKSSAIASIWSDIFKNIAKFVSDKSVEVRLQVGKCYKAASGCLKGAALTQHYETLYNAVWKGFEDDQKSVREAYIGAMFEAMSSKLDESLLEKAFNSNTKRKATEPPKNFSDVFNALQPIFLRETNAFKECTVICIWKIMKANPEYIRFTKPLIILQIELTWLSRFPVYSFESYSARIHLEWLFIEYTKLLDIDLKIKLMSIILNNLEKIVEKHDKGEQQANENQVIVIVSALNALILQLGSHIVEHNPSVNHITDIVVPLLKWERPSVRIYAVECIKSLVYRCKPWLCQLLSLFLNMTTVSHAELAALPPGPLFTDKKSAGDKNGLLAYYTSLNVESSCLSALLHCTELQLSGVPLDIANAALVAAKGIILGYYHKDPEEAARLSEGKPRKETELVAKRHAGWIVIQGLLGLGTSWISSNLSTLVKLWNMAFDKESCMEMQNAGEDGKYNTEQLAQEFVVKAEALTALHEFMVNYKELINPQVTKFISNALVNFSHYVFQNATKEPKKSLFEMFSTKYICMKAVKSLNIISIGIMGFLKHYASSHL